MNKTRMLGILLLIAPCLMVLHYISLKQCPFDIDDILHHELFEATFFTAGIVLLINMEYNRSGRRDQT